MLSRKSKRHLNRYNTKQEQNTSERVFYLARAKYIWTGMLSSKSKIHLNMYIIQQEQNTSKQVYYPARAKHIWTFMLSSKSKTHLNRYNTKQEQNTSDQAQWTIRRHLNPTMTFPGKTCLRRDRHPKSVTFWKRPEPLNFIFKTCRRLNKNPTRTRFCNLLFSVQDIFITPYLPWNIANL